MYTKNIMKALVLVGLCATHPTQAGFPNPFAKKKSEENLTNLLAKAVDSLQDFYKKSYDKVSNEAKVSQDSERFLLKKVPKDVKRLIVVMHEISTKAEEMKNNPAVELSIDEKKTFDTAMSLYKREEYFQKVYDLFNKPVLLDAFPKLRPQYGR